MRVLALVPGGIERQLEFFPVLGEIKNAFGAADIAVVADPAAKEVYRLSKAVDEVVPYNFQASNSPADWANLLGIMRDREFEAVITLTDSWSIALLLWLSGIPTRIGYEGSANNLFLTTTVARSADAGFKQYEPLLKGLNLSATLAAPTLSLPQGDLNTVESLRQAAKLGGGYVAVYPGSSAGDLYPTDKWVAILKDFQQRQPDLPLVMVQTADTVKAIAAISQSIPGLTVLESETIGQLAALIAGANLLLSVEGYPLALAAALEVYAVGLSAAPLSLVQGNEERLVNVVSDSGKLADIDPTAVLKQVWNE